MKVMLEYFHVDYWASKVLFLVSDKYFLPKMIGLVGYFQLNKNIRLVEV